MILPDQFYTAEEILALLKYPPVKKPGRTLDRMGIPSVPMGRRRLYAGDDVLAVLTRKRIR